MGSGGGLHRSSVDESLIRSRRPPASPSFVRVIMGREKADWATTSLAVRRVALSLWIGRMNPQIPGEGVLRPYRRMGGRQSRSATVIREEPGPSRRSTSIGGRLFPAALVLLRARRRPRAFHPRSIGSSMPGCGALWRSSPAACPDEAGDTGTTVLELLTGSSADTSDPSANSVHGRFLRDDWE
jgi:hypothetical protein